MDCAYSYIIAPMLVPTLGEEASSRRLAVLVPPIGRAFVAQRDAEGALVLASERVGGTDRIHLRDGMRSLLLAFIHRFGD